MHQFLEYQVADVMTYRPVTIGRRASVAEAALLFQRRDFNTLPVGEDGCLLGVVTKLDFLRAFAFTPGGTVPPYEEIMRQPVEDVMVRTPDTVSPETPLSALLQRMVATRHRSFPVVIGALLVGIVAREDVMRALRWAAVGRGPQPGEGAPRRHPSSSPIPSSLSLR